VLELRLHENEPLTLLTVDDLNLIRAIVREISAGFDARLLFWEPITNRPGGKDRVPKECAALDIALDTASAPADRQAIMAWKLKAEKKWGLTHGQVDHAWREFGATARARAASMQHSRLRGVQAMRLAILRRQKRPRGK
jgi:hypothetical protein